MGRAIRGLLPDFPDVGLVACVAPTSDQVECPDGCAWLTPEKLFAGKGALPSDVVAIDVSLAAGTVRLLEWLERAPHPLVAATTGLSEADESRIRALGSRAAVLRARNLSVGNSVASGMLRSVPAAARGSFEIDVIEHHHAAKLDAPSGTALAWAASLVPGRPDLVRTESSARESRPPGEIRIHSIRSGTAAGTHRVLLAGAGETLELVHVVSDRAVFARGALRAASFLHGKPPGFYTFDQLLAEA